MRRKSSAVESAFGEWGGSRLVLVGHVVRQGRVDSTVPPSTMLWIGPEPDSTKMWPITDDAMAVISAAAPGEDVPATVARLHGGASPERLHRMRKNELEGLVALGLARLERVSQ